MRAITAVRSALVAVLIVGMGVMFSHQAAAQEAATIRLLHGIPGVAVDVVVDGNVVFANFQGGETQDLSSFAGKTLTKLEVRLAGTTTTVIGPTDFPVPDSGNWTAVAYLDADGKPTFKAFPNETSPTEAGQGRLVVTHVAAAPAVDLVVGDARPITNLANGQSQMLALGAGPISGAKIAPTGADPIADVPTLDLVAGTDLLVYAVGSVADKTFTFYTLSVKVGENSPVTSTSTTTTTVAPTTTTTVPPTTTTAPPVTVGPTSTTAAPQAGTATVTLLHGIPGVAVDVVVDGKVVFANFQGGQTQDLSSFSGQTLTKLEVRLAGTTTTVIGPIDFPVPASGNWTAVAHLDATGKPTLNAFPNPTGPTEKGKGRLVVTHVAAAPAVDLVVGTTRPITNLANGKSQERELPAGPISGAKIAPTGGNPIADVPTVDLVAGADLIVYAVGSLADKTFTFYTQKITVGESATAVTTTSSTTTSTTTPVVTSTSTTIVQINPPVTLPKTGSSSTVWIFGLLVTMLGLVLLTVARRGAHSK